MEKTKKPKVIVRELAPKMKIIEKEENSEVEEEKEIPLEDIAEMPSTGAFRPFSEPTITEQRAPEVEVQTPSATTRAENQGAARYSIQKDVNEKEIRKVYAERVSEASVSGQRALVLNPQNPQRQSRADMFRNSEVDSLRTAEDEAASRYEITPEKRAQATARKYPWEA